MRPKQWVAQNQMTVRHSQPGAVVERLELLDADADDQQVMELAVGRQRQVCRPLRFHRRGDVRPELLGSALVLVRALVLVWALVQCVLPLRAPKHRAGPAVRPELR